MVAICYRIAGHVKQVPLKGQDEASLRLTMRSGVFLWPTHFQAHGEDYD